MVRSLWDDLGILDVIMHNSSGVYGRLAKVEDYETG